MPSAVRRFASVPGEKRKKGKIVDARRANFWARSTPFPIQDIKVPCNCGN